ncbi:hypothetical protein BC827DRAFT_1243595 [Russula dissimulans]|nr:hypothetical protein BC827DRAFT_1243595 [Russula dissimulans]
MTIGTVIWLASSLPGDVLGGLSALGGVATHATEALVGGVSSVGNALAGTATHIVGDAANTLSHLGDGLHAIPTGGLFPHVGQGQDAIQGAVSNANAITGAVIGSTQGVATELVHALDPLHLISKGSQDSQQKQPVSGAQAVSAAIQQAADPLAAIKATQAAATENATKIANALESVNPLHLNIALKGLQASPVPPNPIGNLLHPKIPGLRS